MIRLSFFVLQILVLGAGAFWLFKNPGSAHIEWMGYEIETSFSFVVLALIAVIFASNILWHAVKLILTFPWQIRKLFKKRHLRKGMVALYQALFAIEQRDSQQLQKATQRVRKFLNEPALALYLEGIAARTFRDYSTAHEKFRALSQLPQGEALGVLTSLKLALAEQHWPIAWSLYEQMPDEVDLSSDILVKLLDVALELEKFEDALNLIATIKRQKSLSNYELRSLRAKIALRRSQHLKNVHHNEDAAYVTAQEAYDLEPSLETAVQLVPFLLQRQKNRKAKDVLRFTWDKQPSKEIVPLVKQLEANSSDLNAYSILNDWSQDITDHPERSLVLAHCASQANLWGEARVHLNRLPEGQDYYLKKNLLLADIEFQENHDVEKSRLLYRQLLETKE